MISLAGQRILVIEDLYDLAMEAKLVLETAGAVVVGPFAFSDDALLSVNQRPPDCALLDVNLGVGASFDLARVLRMRNIPFLFFTGYDRDALPSEFADVERLEKPVDPTHLLQALRACSRVTDTSDGEQGIVSA